MVRIYQREVKMPQTLDDLTNEEFEQL